MGLAGRAHISINIPPGWYTDAAVVMTVDNMVPKLSYTQIVKGLA